MEKLVPSKIGKRSKLDGRKGSSRSSDNTFLFPCAHVSVHTCRFLGCASAAETFAWYTRSLRCNYDKVERARGGCRAERGGKVGLAQLVPWSIDKGEMEVTDAPSRVSLAFPTRRLTREVRCGSIRKFGPLRRDRERRRMFECQITIHSSSAR